MFCRVEHEKSFKTSRPVFDSEQTLKTLVRLLLLGLHSLSVPFSQAIRISNFQKSKLPCQKLNFHLAEKFRKKISIADYGKLGNNCSLSSLLYMVVLITAINYVLK